jgi:hypothetical protein
MFKVVIILIFASTMAYPITKDALSAAFKDHPFSYNLGIKVIPSKNTNTDVTICCHGYGHNNQIVDIVNSFNMVPGILIGFNFPDYNITSAVDHKKASYGTINEILPLLYILKRCIIDLKIPTINLYGFSAGGGALINALAVLNQSNYTAQLEQIGITVEVRKQIIRALEQGLIILDCPLKSFDEISTAQGTIPELEILATTYKKNNMTPLVALQQLAGLNLNILLHFQNPDEILGNRDDQLYIDRLKKVNRGKTTIIIGSDGGHNVYHKALWTEYKKLNHNER